MVKTLLSLKALLISVTILSLPFIAAAQATRTWVAGMGDDINACSRSQPCKTFAGAISKTSTGGEINTIDAGGYGTVVISKSITIDGTGGMAGVLSTGSNGIIINITSAGDSAKTVRLRRLSLNGGGTGMDGIKIVSAGQVFIDEVLVDGFTQNGVNLGASGAYVSVTKSIVRNIRKFGFNLVPGGTAPSAMVSLDSTTVSTCEAGVYAGSGVVASIRDSSFQHNLIGVSAEDADVAMVNCLVAHGGRGLMARARGVIRISQVTVTRNDLGLVVTNGKIISFKNNIIHGNRTDGAPTDTFPEM